MNYLKDPNNNVGSRHTAKYEPLRPLARAVLQKNEITPKDLDYLTQKAVGLGMDPEEFRLLWESLAAAKKRACKSALFRKQKCDNYFETDQFNQDFDEVFLTEEERNDKMMSELNLFREILGGDSVIDDALSLVKKAKKLDF